MDAPAHQQPADRLDRPLRDLRISVTDRCNFRCRYCMPREVFGAGYRFLPRAEILTYEEIARLAAVLSGLGARKLRLTGGEPLLRRDLPELVRLLDAVAGIDEIAMTTNGSRLAEAAAGLAAAGLDRVTVSLDSLDDAVFRAMNDVDFPVARVLAGVDAALAAGLGPVKINAVVHRGVNDHTVVELARRFHGTGVTVRFIEYMDVGATNGWRLDDVVPGAEIVRRIAAELPLEPVEPSYRGEVARRWRYADGGGEIGIITSVTAPFCGDCTRARLSAEGRLYTCLFATEGFDFRTPLRAGATDAELARLAEGIWRAREDRYSELRTAATADPSAAETPPSSGRVEMSYIGG
jgi:cyclic pyranopterin phosphate synthase